MLALPQEISTCLRLDKLSVKVDWIFNCLILYREDFDSQHHLVKEEFGQDVLLLPTCVLMSRKAEIDAVFHHKEALLTLVSLESLQKLAIDLRESPSWDLVWSALRIDISVS